MTQYRATWIDPARPEDERVVDVGTAEDAERYALDGWMVERRETGQWREMNPRGTTYRAFEDFRWAFSLAWEAYKDSIRKLIFRA